MRGSLKSVLLVAVLLAATAGGVGRAGAQPVGPALTNPGDIAAGSDGNMWFTEPGGNRIGRITPTGVVTEFSTGISRDSVPVGIAAGPDGNLWFTEIGSCSEEGCVGGNRIGRITPAGVVTEYSKGISPKSYPADIAAGPDGNLWFTEVGTRRIGRITLAGVVTEFSAGISRGFAPVEIAAGADGHVWFVESDLSESPTFRIGRITTSGAITEFGEVPGGSGLAAGPDGNMWLAEGGARRIGRISPAGSVTHFFKGIGRGGYLSAISAGPDGNMWSTKTDWGAGQSERIGRITPTGVVTEFGGLSSGSSPQAIAAGADGNLWFTESDGNRIGRITPAGVISEFPATAQIERVEQRGTRAVVVSLHCPQGAAETCRGVLRLRHEQATGGSGSFALAPDQRADVAVAITPGLRRLLLARNHLTVSLLLRPVPTTMAGAVWRRVTLRTGPATPRVPGIRLARPQGIAAGLDGNMWFAECEGNRIGRITPSGVITEFPVPTRDSCPTAITAGPDGNMWFTELYGEAVGRITPSGVITEFEGMGPGSFPRDITLGPDGNLWVTGGPSEDISVKRITPAGDITEFPVGNVEDGAFPHGITAGPDGKVWFTLDRDNPFTASHLAFIGSITSMGVSTMSPPTSFAGADDITLGSDGNLWFTEFSANRIGRITPSGVITRFTRGIGSSDSPMNIAAGPDGNLWFTAINGHRIVRITPRGRVTGFSTGLSRGNISRELPFPENGTSPWGIAAGPDGNIWFTEAMGNRIGRITPRGVISEFPATAQILSVRQLGVRSVVVRVRCPAGAALACRGTVQLGKAGNGGSRRIRPVAPGGSALVVVPLAPAWQRLIAKRRLDILVVLRPQPNSMAGAVGERITLRAAGVRIPPVTG